MLSATIVKLTREPGSTEATDLAIREAFARDASGLQLVPDSVARPGAREDVIDLLRRASLDGFPVTPAGGQTSTTGASITDQRSPLDARSSIGSSTSIPSLVRPRSSPA